MAEFPCPYCGQAVATDTEDNHSRCPSCDGSLLIAYRYRLVARRGELSGGELYEAMDDGFDERMAVLFARRDADAASLARFIEGNRLFAELGGGRGIVRIYDIGGDTTGNTRERAHRRPYMVMDWIADGTLESRVNRNGALDMPTLVETAGDLLTGLAKAHRAMPSIVHNHIHPGKIGFLTDDEIVMFGFEYAEQVFEQDSSLADTFIEAADPSSKGQRRAADLRQLGHALFYAASGQWIAELSTMQQRAHVREQLQGPIALLLDRLLDAGRSGYRTAVDAIMDFNRLLRGDHSSWRPRQLPKQTHLTDLAASAWTEASLALGADDLFEGGDAIEELELEPYTFDDDDDFSLDSSDPRPERPERPAQRPPPSPAAASFDNQAYAATQAQLAAQQAQAQAQSGSASRTLGVVMALVIGGGVCVASLANTASDYDAEAEAERIRMEIDQMEADRALQAELEEINRQAQRQAELDRMREQSLPAVPQLDGTYRYEGVITGPEDIAGPYKIGDKCEIYVAPNEELDSELNCRWYIDCKRKRSARRIYGGGTAGYSTCELAEDGSPLRASDEEDEVYDGAFVAELGGPQPMVMVLDRWLIPPTRVLISIAGTGERHERRVPNVRLAERIEQEIIEAAIAADHYPVFPD